MKDFKGLVRDTTKDNNPVGTWQLGRNMILNKAQKSITNEEGFKFEYLVNGTVIGIIATNKDIVYFSKNDDGTDEIGVVNDNNEAPVYEVKIKGDLNFHYNCPIEGVFVYNFKEELIVSWCDGIKTNSNPPKIANLTTLPFETNPDGTLVDPAQLSLLNMTGNKRQGALEIDYLDNGQINGYSLYITIAYVFNDDSRTAYFSSSDIAYLGTGVDPTENKGVRLSFTDLDSDFNKFKIGLVLKTEGTDEEPSVLEGYESDILEYSGTEFSIDILSLEDFFSIEADEIIIEETVFSKVNTMTKHENQAIIANVETNSGDIGFQPYANMLNLVPFEYIDDYTTDYKEQNASLMPDEVYSVYIQLHKLDGTYTDGYHIPGRAAEGTERDSLTASQITDYDLTELNNENTLKQFHIFNNGVAAGVPFHGTTTPTNNTEAVDESGNKMGYWENEELYPNDDNYDSSSLGGEDLRGTPIRYHRMPSIKSMLDNTTNTAGNTYSPSNYPWGMPRRAKGSPYNPFTDYNHQPRIRKLGIKITNIEDVIPASILNQIQGYRLLHVKRNNANNYVLGNWILTRRQDVGDPYWTGGDGFGSTDGGAYEYHDFGWGGNGSDIETFEKVRVLNNDINKYKPSLSPTYIQTNYNFPINIIAYQGGSDTIANSERFSKCYSPLTYRLGNNASINTQYHEEGVNLDLKPNYISRDLSDNYFDSVEAQYDYYMQYYVLNATAYNHILNVYQGFKSDNLNIIGRTNVIENNTKFKGGDNFASNTINCWTRGINWGFETFQGGGGYYRRYERFTNVFIQGVNCATNMSELYSIPPTDAYTTDPALLNNYDYDYDTRGKGSISEIHDINTVFTFDIDSDFITRFPYRIYRGLKIPNESLTAKALSTFPISDYYEMPNDKGEIIAVRSRNKTLFIQHRHSLFAASVKDKLKTQGEDTYLGQSDLFDRIPDELISDSKGYVGSCSKFACVVVKDMFVTVNQITGQIFIVKGNIIEISDKGNKQWFWKNWDNGLDFYDLNYQDEKQRIDNPYCSVGHIVGYDKQYNRLLFTKKKYRYKFPEHLEDENLNITFDGEFYKDGDTFLNFDDNTLFDNLSKTLSYDLDRHLWLFEHDYFPNLYFNTTYKLHSIKNTLTGENRARIYEHNDSNTKGYYYETKFDSYVDLIFNGHSDISKLYKNIIWITKVINQNKGIERDKTITHIMLYNDHQCSGVINLKDNLFDLTRNIEEEWHFNDFRDLVINASSPIIDDNGEVINSNINSLKVWFEKSNFISKFIVVRLIYDNIENNDIHINQVNVHSIRSHR